MNQEVQTYDFHGSTVRLLADAQGTPWFVAKDICDVLGLGNITEALRALDDDEKTNFRNSEVAQNGGRDPLIVSEAGFYKLVMRSRKPVAKEFQRWVTHDVLPSIRQHGAYMTQQTIEQVLTDPDTLIRLATDLKHEREARAQAEQQVRSLTPKAQAFADFCEAPGLSTVRDAAAMLTAAGIPIREGELRAWMLDNGWIYRKGNGYRPYAAHTQAGHLRLEPPRGHGTHHDGTQFAFDPVCKITRRGLTLLYQRIGSERIANRLDYTPDAYALGID